MRSFQAIQVLQAMFPAAALYLLAIAVVLLAGHGARRLESEERAGKYFYLARNLTIFLVAGVGYSYVLSFQAGGVESMAVMASHYFFMAMGVPACLFMQLNKMQERWLLTHTKLGLTILGLAITFFAAGVCQFDVASGHSRYDASQMNGMVVLLGLSVEGFLLLLWYFLKSVFLQPLPRQ